MGTCRVYLLNWVSGSRLAIDGSRRTSGNPLFQHLWWSCLSLLNLESFIAALAIMSFPLNVDSAGFAVTRRMVLVWRLLRDCSLETLVYHRVLRFKGLLRALLLLDSFSIIILFIISLNIIINEEESKAYTIEFAIRPFNSFTDFTEYDRV